MFAQHPMMTLWYAELADQQERGFDGVLAFLGVERAALTITLVRQNPEPLSELIANYDELRHAFDGGEYASFFD